MADKPGQAPGEIGWVDLTVPDARAVREFYQRVIGWTSFPVDMGGYQDYSMNAGNRTVAGICHAHGGSIGVPAGSTAIGRYCVVEDPGGAVAALFEPAR